MNKLSRVAYLGPPGTFSQLALINHFAELNEAVPCGSIDEVFHSVEKGSADAGIVPVENSTEGAVNNTQDCLIDTDCVIVGEEIVQIVHNLMAAPGTDPKEINAIASHKQSLAQCRQWLKKHYPQVQLVECVSNAEAARLACEKPGTAAIAGALAAETFGLEIIAAAIQDQQHNSTRFLVLANAAAAPSATANDKTSVLIYTANKPGALFRVLEPFEQLQISLSKIDSRPSKKEAWEYVFFIDFEGHVDDDITRTLFSRLKSCTEEIKVLGSYPVFQTQGS